MTERETDFEFDFFDEPATDETAREERGRLPRRGGPRRPLRPPTRLAPLLRLVVAIAVAILVVVLLVFWIQSCQGENKTRSYRNYMADLSFVASQSQNVGKQLTTVLTTPGIRKPQLSSQLSGLTQQEAQDLARAQKLTPPGRLREAHDHVLEALQFRLSGLTGLRDAIARMPQSTSGDRAGALLANQARRFIASDVIWDDRFKDPSKTTLRNEDVGGVVVPDSTFLRNPDLASSSSFAQFWQRLRGAATGGNPTGLRGTALSSVKVLPSGETLTPGGEAVVKTGTDLAFQVTVQDSGEAQEVRVPVTLTIDKRTGPSIVKRQVIDVIDPGQTKTVTFRDIGNVDFGVPRQVKVEVKPVRGEARTENNSATYTVTFSLP